MTYRVRNWSTYFENNRTRDLKRMEWLPIPNKHDGDGYTDLVSRSNGLALYGAWVLMLQVASKCEPRGTLLRDGKKPHDATSLARMTRSNPRAMEEAIKACLEIGWLEVIPNSDNTLQNPAPSCGKTAPSCGEVPMEWKGMEGNGREEDSPEPQTAASVPSPPLLLFSTVGTPNTWSLTQAKLDEFAAVYSGVDVLSECKKAKLWTDSNPGKRKTANGMSKFLMNWLNRAVDSGRFKPVQSKQTKEEKRQADEIRQAQQYEKFDFDGAAQ